MPIALTYKGERDFKDKFREQTDFLGQQIEARVTDQISRMNDVRDSLDCRIELFDSTLCRIENLENDIDLEMCISSIASIRNNRLLEHSHDLREAYINLAIRPLRQFVVIFQAKLSDDNILSNEQERWSLIKMRFQIYEILRNMTYDHSGPSRPRFLYQGEESLKILIRELMNEFPSIENIRNQMNIVAANIAMIIRRVRESEAMS